MNSTWIDLAAACWFVLVSGLMFGKSYWLYGIFTLLLVGYLLNRGRQEALPDVGERVENSRENGDGTMRGLNASEARASARKRSSRRSGPQKTRTDSGLIYQVIEKGTGERPAVSDRVRVRYRGYFPSGEEFDRSPDQQTVTFPLKAVIKGWREGLQMMRVGSKYRFVIPPELAYGESGVGSKIGPNQTLVFDVELEAIEKNNRSTP